MAPSVANLPATKLAPPSHQGKAINPRRQVRGTSCLVPRHSSRASEYRPGSPQRRRTFASLHGPSPLSNANWITIKLSRQKILADSAAARVLTRLFVCCCLGSPRWCGEERVAVKGGRLRRLLEGRRRGWESKMNRVKYRMFQREGWRKIHR